MIQNNKKRNRNESESKDIQLILSPPRKKVKETQTIISYMNEYEKNCWRLLSKKIKIEILKYLSLNDIEKLYELSQEFKQLIDNEALIKSLLINYTKKFAKHENKTTEYVVYLFRNYEYFHFNYLEEKQKEEIWCEVIGEEDIYGNINGLLYKFKDKRTFDKDIHSFVQKFKHYEIIQAYNRVINYVLLINYKIKIVHEEEIIPRTLNYYEKKLFKEFELVYFKNNGDVTLNSKEKCIETLERKYVLSKWNKCINWNNIVWAGGSLLNVVDNNCNTDGVKSNVDLFGYNIKGEAEMNELIYPFMYNLIEEGHSVRKLNTKIPYITLEVIFDDNFKKVRFDFIWRKDIISISSVFNHFDLDICQVGYNGNNFICTDAWIEAFRTRTMICATLPRNEVDMKHCIYRIKKYIWRGYKLLIPYDIDEKKILKNIIFDINKKRVERNLMFNESKKRLERYVKLSGVMWMFKHNVSRIKEKFIQLLRN